eukprot:TCALIF_10788-PA protein Name:"Similar to OVCH2 Ovochymase-2 (Bufo japonicus)" AED:0.11 eAED:0.11 QI:0/0.6/0.16/0.83/1/1/6/0/354
MNLPELKPPGVPEMVKKAKSFYRQQKVVGGKPFHYGDAPWLASIKYRDGNDFYTYCGGTLISDRFVLTAAHCVQFQATTELFVGIGDYDRNSEDPGEVLSAVVRIHTHPNFSTLTFESDLALLELAQHIRFDRYKQPAVLARPGTHVTGLRFNVTGWGTLRERGEYSAKVRQALVPYVPYEVCRGAYKDLSITARILPGMICAGWLAGGGDACQGDSGGPLTLLVPIKSQANNASTPTTSKVRGISLRIRTKDRQRSRSGKLLWSDLDSQEKKRPMVQSSSSMVNHLLHSQTELHKSRQVLSPKHGVPTILGVVSWGMGCGRPSFAGVYTDVRAYRTWIIQTMGGEPEHIWTLD